MIQSIKWDGKPITTPGIYSHMPLDDYHRGDICDGPSVSSSGLRTIWAESPAHFWCTSPLNPDRVEREEKTHFNIGRAAHHVICGQAFFAAEYVIRPDQYEDEETGKLKPWHGSATACKRWMAAAAKDGKTVLTTEDAKAVERMAVRLGENEIIRAGLLNGWIERSIFWRDKETGLWLKARPDAIPSDSGTFADLKTTTSVRYLKLIRTIADYNYHMQGAMVLDGARALGLVATEFVLAFVEKDPPNCVRIVALRDDDLVRGHKQNRVAIRTLAHCLSSKTWPGPGDDRDDVEPIDLPEREREYIDKRLQLQLSENV